MSIYDHVNVTISDYNFFFFFFLNLLLYDYFGSKLIGIIISTYLPTPPRPDFSTPTASAQLVTIKYELCSTLSNP